MASDHLQGFLLIQILAQQKAKTSFMTMLLRWNRLYRFKELTIVCLSITLCYSIQPSYVLFICLDKHSIFVLFNPY